MARVSLPGRVSLIVIVAAFAGLLTLIAAGYASNGVDRSAELPAPERLAALAEAVERAGPDQRALVIAAVSNPRFAVTVLAEPLQAVAAPTLWPADAEAVEAYEERLVDRPLAIVPLTEDRPLRRFFASALNAVEFRIGLETGETLVVATRSPFAVTPSGLPIGFGAGLIGIMIALLTLILLHREFRPLTRLAAALEKVDPAGDGIELPQIRARSPELKALILAFERLQDRLSTLVRARMALVGGIQHDLRTFATRLRLRTDRIADPEDRARAAADIADMISLLDDALLASRAGASELDEELIDLAALVSAEVADRNAAGAPVTLTVEASAAEAAILGDRLALRRIVANLVDNALRYGQRARLRLDVADDRVRLVVDDEG
ncbi:MAG: HAMP domain-containing sensor histidine kinase, partial [Pseudomonadota bacterium]